MRTTRDFGRYERALRSPALCLILLNPTNALLRGLEATGRRKLSVRRRGFRQRAGPIARLRQVAANGRPVTLTARDDPIRRPVVGSLGARGHAASPRTEALSHPSAAAQVLATANGHRGGPAEAAIECRALRRAEATVRVRRATSDGMETSVLRRAAGKTGTGAVVPNPGAGVLPRIAPIGLDAAVIAVVRHRRRGGDSTRTLPIDQIAMHATAVDASNVAASARPLADIGPLGRCPARSDAPRDGAVPLGWVRSTRSAANRSPTGVIAQPAGVSVHAVMTARGVMTDSGVMTARGVRLAHARPVPQRGSMAARLRLGNANPRPFRRVGNLRPGRRTARPMRRGGSDNQREA